MTTPAYNEVDFQLKRITELKDKVFFEMNPRPNEKSKEYEVKMKVWRALDKICSKLEKEKSNMEIESISDFLKVTGYTMKPLPGKRKLKKAINRLKITNDDLIADIYAYFLTND